MSDRSVFVSLFCALSAAIVCLNFVTDANEQSAIEKLNDRLDELSGKVADLRGRITAYEDAFEDYKRKNAWQDGTWTNPDGSMAEAKALNDAVIARDAHGWYELQPIYRSTAGTGDGFAFTTAHVSGPIGAELASDADVSALMQPKWKPSWMISSGDINDIDCVEGRTYDAWTCHDHMLRLSEGPHASRIP